MDHGATDRERSRRHDSVDGARLELESARAPVGIADGRCAPGEHPGRTRRDCRPVPRRRRCCEGPVQFGESVLALGDLDALEVKVDLLSVDAVRVRPGMRVVPERWAAMSCWMGASGW
jgi:HlyD family secretion protein